MERIPILQMGDVLLVTIQVDMHDQLALTLQDDLAERIRATSARGVLIEISALDIVDSFIGRMIATISALAAVMETKLVTAASELARNAVVYGGGGTMSWHVVRDGMRAGIRLEFVDQGPGIADIAQALTDGWTSGTGMGLGLSGSRRLVDAFEIDSAPGRGTRVAITKWA